MVNAAWQDWQVLFSMQCDFLFYALKKLFILLMREEAGDGIGIDPAGFGILMIDELKFRLS